MQSSLPLLVSLAYAKPLDVSTPFCAMQSAGEDNVRPFLLNYYMPAIDRRKSLSNASFISNVRAGEYAASIGRANGSLSAAQYAGLDGWKKNFPRRRLCLRKFSLRRNVSATTRRIRYPRADHSRLHKLRIPVRLLHSTSFWTTDDVPGHARVRPFLFFFFSSHSRVKRVNESERGPRKRTKCANM